MTVQSQKNDSSTSNAVASADGDCVCKLGVAEARKELQNMLEVEINGRPFTELAGVTFHHRGAELAGQVLLDALQEAGYSAADFDAVGALTAAAVPLVDAVLHAATQRGQKLNAFVMDFVYPSIKGPSISGKRVLFLDAWLSEKSYVQTSSLVTLRNGNELSLDCGIVNRQGASIVAVVSLVGGIGIRESYDSVSSPSQQLAEDPLRTAIKIVDPIDAHEEMIPFVSAFDESLFEPVVGESQSADNDCEHMR